jgi:hypothetical protein
MPLPFRRVFVLVARVQYHGSNGIPLIKNIQTSRGTLKQQRSAANSPTRHHRKAVANLLILFKYRLAHPLFNLFQGQWQMAPVPRF